MTTIKKNSNKRYNDGITKCESLPILFERNRSSNLVSVMKNDKDAENNSIKPNNHVKLGILTERKKTNHLETNIISKRKMSTLVKDFPMGCKRESKLGTYEMDMENSVHILSPDKE